MANTIGGLAFIRIDGELDQPSQKGELIPAPYKDGMAARRSHIRGREVELTAVRDCTNLTAAKSLEDSYKALEWTVQDVVKDGITYSNQLITDVTIKLKQQGAVGVGGITPNGSAIIQVAFTVVDVNPP